MKRILMATVIAVFVGSAVALSSPPETQPPKVPVPAPVAAKFSGTYIQSADGVTTNLLLRPDGSYAASVRVEGFFGLLPSGHAIGNWRVTGKTLILTPFWQDELGRDWFSHMDAMHIVHQDGDRFTFLRRCDITALQAEPDLAVYCFFLHEWSFQRTDQPKGPVPAPNAAKVAGTYYRGDRLGSNYDLALQVDGTYTVESYGCMGKSGDASGTWQVVGNTLTLSPRRATGHMKDFAKTLDVIERDGRIVFVEPDMRTFFKKYGTFTSYWCFKRTDRPEK